MWKIHVLLLLWAVAIFAFALDASQQPIACHQTLALEVAGSAG